MCIRDRACVTLPLVAVDKLRHGGLEIAQGHLRLSRSEPEQALIHEFDELGLDLSLIHI